VDSFRLEAELAAYSEGIHPAGFGSNGVDVPSLSLKSRESNSAKSVLCCHLSAISPYENLAPIGKNGKGDTPISMLRGQK